MLLSEVHLVRILVLVCKGNHYQSINQRILMIFCTFMLQNIFQKPARIDGSLVRNHWAIESMHWALDFNLLQDRIKRKSAKAARNLDSIQRIVHSVFSIWKRLRKKRSDKKKGMAELMRYVSMSFTRLLRFLYQK